MLSQTPPAVTAVSLTRHWGLMFLAVSIISVGLPFSLQLDQGDHGLPPATVLATLGHDTEMDATQVYQG